MVGTIICAIIARRQENTTYAVGDVWREVQGAGKRSIQTEPH